MGPGRCGEESRPAVIDRESGAEIKGGMKFGPVAIDRKREVGDIVGAGFAEK